MITATDSPAQKYATVFPEYFVKAMKEASTDLDKNGRTSIFEVFTAASAAVKQHYEQRGQLTTERALLDDNGDGKGREATAEGPDGGIARIAYLDSEVVAESANPELAALIRRRRALEQQAEEHKELKGVMPDAEWQATVRKADARARAGVSGESGKRVLEQLTISRSCISCPSHRVPPLDLRAFRSLHEHDQDQSSDEAHHVRPERDAA